MAAPVKLKTEEALLRVAADLLEREGPQGVTTRAVCAAAAVKAPTLYHHFGDKNGLLDALVCEGIEMFLNTKRAVGGSSDALEGLVSGWDSFIAFALDRPRLFKLMALRIEENPDILAAVMATTHARLRQLSDQGLLAKDLAFARQAMLALAVGVTALATHGEPRAEVEAVGRFLLDAALGSLVRQDRQPEAPRSATRV